jgi:hypothetical protein
LKWTFDVLFVGSNKPVGFCKRLHEGGLAHTACANDADEFVQEKLLWALYSI